MASKRQRLSELFKKMNSQQQESLLDYASFLVHRADAAAAMEESQEKLEPLFSERPDNENVVNAIKRLRASYFMLNTDDLLNESSTLMAQFMLQGRDAQEVIDDLERMFDIHYQKYLES
jgi:hypothetical protein